jgi:tetratricopeptide (TPR) repeat protein
MRVDALLGEGIAAAKSGQRERARDLLTRVVEQDESNVLGWLWLSGVVDSLEDQEICLENVLALDPTHDAARRRLGWVRKQKEPSVSDSGQEIPSPSPSPESTQARKPVSPAAAVLREDFARRQPPPEHEPELPPLPPQDEFDDEYQCPYCAAQTVPDDRQCPACGNKLWFKVRRRQERSPGLWVALTLQFAGTMWPATIPLLMLVYAGNKIGLDNFFRLIPVYLGLPNDVPPEVAHAAFEAVPRLYILPFMFFVLLSLVVLVGLYLRWKPIFYLFLINAFVMLGAAIAGLSIGLGLPGETIVINQRTGALCGGGGIILALMMFLLVLQIADDFFFDQKRLLLRPDRDATNGPALLSSGRTYASRQMWAMAAIHLRRAVAQMPRQIDCHLELSVAYFNLKRYELAANALQEARRIDPNDPQVKHLTTALSSRYTAESQPPTSISR